jgi:hypothetical protein
VRIPELKKQADRFIGPDGKDFPLVKALSEHVFMPWMYHLGKVDLSKEEEESLDSYNPMGDQENERLVRQVEKMKKYVNEKHSTEEKRIEVESQPGVDTATSSVISPLQFFLNAQTKAVAEQMYEVVTIYGDEGFKIPENVKRCPKNKRDIIPVLVSAGRNYLQHTLSLEPADENERFAIEKLQQMCSKKSLSALGRLVHPVSVRYDLETRKSKKKDIVSSLKNALDKVGYDQNASIEEVCTLEWKGESFPRNVEDVVEDEEEAGEDAALA